MNRNNDPNGFFSRPGLPASSRSGSCWACLSTLLLKLNLRFLNQLGRFFSLAFFCRPIFWLKLLDPSGPTLLALLGRLLCSLGLHWPFSPLFRHSLTRWYSRFNVVFGCLLVRLAFSWFGSFVSSSIPELAVSNSSSCLILLLPSVGICSISSSPLLFFPSGIRPVLVPSFSETYWLTCVRKLSRLQRILLKPRALIPCKQSDAEA